jgi:hypothetical protein
MSKFYHQFFFGALLIAALASALIIPPINHTNRLIAGDDVASYYGLPKPDTYEGE